MKPKREGIPGKEGGFALGVFFDGVEILHLHQMRQNGLAGGGSLVADAGQRVVEGVLFVEVDENRESRDVKHVPVKEKFPESA